MPRGMKAVVFVLDELDLFAAKAQQTLLYNLLDALQAADMQVLLTRGCWLRWLSGTWIQGQLGLGEGVCMCDAPLWLPAQNCLLQHMPHQGAGSPPPPGVWSRGSLPHLLYPPLSQRVRGGCGPCWGPTSSAMAA